MVTRSFIRWAGSKKKLIPQLLRYWTSVRAERYVEPFAGSAALFFSITPQKCLLADMNSDLINMYIAVQKNYLEVYKKIKTFELGQLAYYAIRAQDVTKLSEIERAARFIYLNRFCFNGLYRTNKKGGFNVPYALGSTSTLPSEDEFIEFSTAIKNVTFISQDFRETLKNVEKLDFVYIDPPYAVENHRIFKQYGAATFGKEDLLELANLLVKIDEKGAFFVLSYAYCPEAVKAFSGWHIHTELVQRTVSGKASSRKAAKEIMISNLKLSRQKR